ncbi:MAG: hypothetical protein Q7S21_02430 [archaeon]|nr:hypothetical protein [archaeon]
MNKLFEILLFVAFLSLFYSQSVYAVPIEPAPPVIIDLTPVINALNNILGSLNGIGSSVNNVGTGISNLPQDIAGFITNSIRQSLNGFVLILLGIAKILLIQNPNPFNYQSYWLIVVTIISAFYLIAFMAVGLKFLLGSYDEVQRMEAKEWAKNAVILVIAVNASLLFYYLFLLLGSAISLILWNNSLDAFFNAGSLDLLNFFLLGFFVICVLLALITLFFRYLILLAGVMLFPIGIFLYFITPLKNYGQTILHFLGTSILIQVIDVIILTASVLIITEFAGNQSISLLAPSMGFLFIAIINFVILFGGIARTIAGTVSSGHPIILAVRTLVRV